MISKILSYFRPKYVPIPDSERRVLEYYASLVYVEHCEFVKTSEWFV